jgi:hypothetical protein
MIEIRLDVAASFLNFLGGGVLAFDALTASRRTKVKRGGEKLSQAIEKSEQKNPVLGAGDIPLSSPSPETIEKSEEENPAIGPGDLPLTSRSLENWADNRTIWAARIGFCLLTAGCGLDLYSKMICNALLFTN